MKMKAAVLGATGMVGQRFVKMLSENDWFDIECIAASKRTAGTRYGDNDLGFEYPDDILDMTIAETSKNILKEYDIDIAFSALPADVAGQVEAELAEKIAVSTNSAAHRMDADVPLLIPEVNPEHLGLIDLQRKKGWEGCLVTNPNCSTIMLVMTLKPLMDAFGIKDVKVATMQAVSGAGFTGVSSMAILDNVIPYIGKEEQKMEREPKKLLGSFSNDAVSFATFGMTALCTRVPVIDGHTESVFIELERDATEEEFTEALRSFRGIPQERNLPSAPKRPIELRDIPQPRMHRDLGNGMSVTAGRIVKVAPRTFKYVTMGHNTIRGAVGASILNAELLKELEYL
ncbi:MAG: aspartate-semialdehyde dehydrogenase [Candidatus Methanofastidiosa archaeon]|nr:aspartate-semialdehyde dehydrogenase [Candidatus Methanofastidiosa archaeon]